MNPRLRGLCGLLLTAAFLALPGCEKKEAPAGQTASHTPLNKDEIASTRDALARGMRLVAFTSVKPAHVGKECLVMTRRPDGGVRIPPPPPPPGMVQVVGQAVFYRGQLDSISPDSLAVRAAYPTAGNYKRVELQREEIQSIHLAP